MQMNDDDVRNAAGVINGNGELIFPSSVDASSRLGSR
eukprot:CAMPEP_0116119806 /NCGR_PEP_ID=MMETSP0329-20121206/2841_1 /TAXON_ID=697910 /ORGANISM="Pseudo-nitzschia arenysensis, Strain B593" /LENGTH=36 /DNA_ID= /DNA_START= /DNA_END= /DNA_ORIENTATION=